MRKLHFYWLFYVLIFVIAQNIGKAIELGFTNIEPQKITSELEGPNGEMPSITYHNPNDDPRVRDKAAKKLYEKMVNDNSTRQLLKQHMEIHFERSEILQNVLISLAIANAILFYVALKNHPIMIFGSTTLLVCSIFFLSN